MIDLKSDDYMWEITVCGIYLGTVGYRKWGKLIDDAIKNGIIKPEYDEDGWLIITHEPYFKYHAVKVK